MINVGIGSPALWVGFLVFVLLMLALDLGVFHRKSAVVSVKEAAIWSVVWIGMALIFNVWVYYKFGSTPAMEFFAGYIIEKSLSVDNLFVFLVIFKYFAVPPVYQHRVLFYGILGALIMRAFFIILGAELLHRFHAVMYFFGALVVYSGFKLLSHSDNEIHPEDNPVYRLLARFIPSVEQYHGEKFMIRENKRLFATPLFLVLIAIEISDLVFAVDSIPAIFAITSDPFIVFTSNIFAILGLRSLYFLLAGALTRLHYLNYGLAIVLIFVGIKMLIQDFYKIPITISLSIIAIVLGTAAGASLLLPKPPEEEPKVQ
jgi:tellurite resistance protein TerC